MFLSALPGIVYSIVFVFQVVYIISSRFVFFLLPQKTSNEFRGCEMFTQDENSTACSKCGGTWILTLIRWWIWRKRPEGYSPGNHGMILDGWMSSTPHVFRVVITIIIMTFLEGKFKLELFFCNWLTVFLLEEWVTGSCHVVSPCLLNWYFWGSIKFELGHFGYADGPRALL